MLPEISLNILDIAQNSVTAGADLIQIRILIRTKEDTMTIMIKDNGHGMSQSLLSQVTDPFYTTRTTRKVGLGIPFFKYAATLTGGNFTIDSQEHIGTTVTAIFVLSSIDRMPLGDITGTMHTLILMNPKIDFLYTYTVDNNSFTLDTRLFKKVLQGIPFHTSEVSQYIKEYLQENKKEVDHNLIF